MNSQPLVVRRPSWKEDHLALICGIANAGGGVLVIPSSKNRSGSRFKRKSFGFETIPKLARKELGIICTVEPVMDGDHLSLEISIPTPSEPVYYKGNCYLYSGGSNTILDSNSLDKLTNKDTSLPWELTLQPFVNREDIDRDAAYELARLAKQNNAQPGDNGTDAEQIDVVDILSKLNIIDFTTHSLTNIGMLLIHAHPERFIAGASIRIGLLDNSTFTTQMNDEVYGPLVLQLKMATDLIFDKYLTYIKENSEKNIVLPPRAAIEEALLNALVHKDYNSGVRIRVSVSENGLSIDNVGRPPETWTLEDFTGHHNSRPNNPFLASTLNKCGKFTGWGGGIHRIQELCDKGDCEHAKFDLRADEVTVTFPLIKNSAADSERANSAVLSSANNSTNTSAANQAETTNNTQPKVSNSTNSQGQSGISQTKAVGQFAKKSIAAAKNMDLTNTDEYILKVLAVNGRSTAPKIGDLLGVSESTVRRSFKKLRGLGLIERVGSDKAGYWKVIL